ncbi:MAG: hypothetical protein KKD25_01780 [Gammaproteobacteria bacterium]|nr:hypothetical protein [Gammaproteobacteria bacterium]MBU0771777.1 hypothetical protein [Gammaproteobacteria bacterium]MBU0855533.1 hypothetical protein [Gammaproteobacteria bacterium]MBU1846095.1 hypothetical protein [Gammaproteobacteria bacterium]
MRREASIPKMSADAGDKEWARRLRRIYLAGERLKPAQIAMASAALDEVWSGGRCAPMVGEEA